MECQLTFLQHRVRFLPAPCQIRSRRFTTKQFSNKNIIRAVASQDILIADESEKIWRSVRKSLMTVGKSGVTSSHCKSLEDLLKSHKIVKVKVLHTTDIEESISRLTSETKAVHIQTKGNTLLFAEGGLEEGMMQQVANDLLDEQRMIRTRRDDRRAMNKSCPSAVKLPNNVKELLKDLERDRVICSITFDTKTMNLLSEIPEPDQIQILRSINRKKFTKIRNKYFPSDYHLPYLFRLDRLGSLPGLRWYRQVASLIIE